MSLCVDIEKRLGDFRLRVQLEAGDETLALLGASGCGKSMTLRCIAGLQRPDRGRIVVDGVTLFDSERRIDLPPQQRRVGLLFQNYALFPHMTVLQNIRAGARRERDKSRREEAVAQLMERFGLAELAGRYPHQLSGGQQQRVALARILVSDPRILLLDEPFSALDSHLRFRLERELRRVARDFGHSVVLVSHDRDEVYRMADRIAVMNGGQVEVCGGKREVFAAPLTRSGALLTGCKNLSTARRLDETHLRACDWGVTLQARAVPEDCGYVGLRMHDIRPGPGENALRCRVEEVIENPFSVTVMLRPVDAAEGVPLGWETDRETWRRLQGPELTVCLPGEKLLLLRGDDDAAL